MIDMIYHSHGDPQLVRCKDAQSVHESVDDQRNFLRAREEVHKNMTSCLEPFDGYLGPTFDRPETKRSVGPIQATLLCS